MGTCLILVIAPFFKTNREKTLSFFYAALTAALCSILIMLSVHYYRIAMPIPVMAFLLCLPFCIGPLIYFYSGFITGFLESFELRDFRHSLPAPAVFAASAVFLSLQGNTISIANENTTLWCRLVAGMMLVQFSCYAVYTLKKILDQYRFLDRIIRETQVLIFLIIASVFCVSATILPLVASGLLYHPAFILVTMFICVHFWITQRHPIFAGMHTAVKESTWTRRPEETPESLDLKKKLNRLLEEDKIYLYEELTLSMLANDLDIKPHQLSSFMNSHLGKNFSSLVNSYRVQDARHKLIHEPEKSIITIGFEVGFNSKASFNRVFKAETKMSPSEYRKFFIRMSKEQFY